MGTLRQSLAEPLSDLAKGIIESRLSYLSPEKLSRVENAARYACSVTRSGAVVELGVALGGTAVVIAKVGNDHGRSFHGFDVFGMIPAPDPEKDDDRSIERYQKIAKGEARGIAGDPYYGYMSDLMSVVERNFKTYGLDVGGRHIQLHKGLFADTLPTQCPPEVAFCHIDGDWYDSVRVGLEEISPRLVVNGCIVVDDYHFYGGARHAVDEFLANHQDFTMLDGANVILYRP